MTDLQRSKSVVLSKPKVYIASLSQMIEKDRVNIQPEVELNNHLFPCRNFAKKLGLYQQRVRNSYAKCCKVSIFALTLNFVLWNWYNIYVSQNLCIPWHLNNDAVESDYTLSCFFDHALSPPLIVVYLRVLNSLFRNHMSEKTNISQSSLSCIFLIILHIKQNASHSLTVIYTSVHNRTNDQLFRFIAQKSKLNKFSNEIRIDKSAINL